MGMSNPLRFLRQAAKSGETAHANPPSWTVMPFAAMAALAVVGGGVLAAVMAHAPSRTVMWAVAYLVLVVGVIQAVLGVGQALLLQRAPAVRVVTLEWLAFNAGNAGVIIGTVVSAWWVVLLGTLLFALALAFFLHATRAVRCGWPAYAYRLLIVFMGGSAVVGLLLSALRTMH